MNVQQKPISSSINPVIINFMDNEILYTKIPRPTGEGLDVPILGTQ